MYEAGSDVDEYYEEEDIQTPWGWLKGSSSEDTGGGASGEVGGVGGMYGGGGRCTMGWGKDKEDSKDEDFDFEEEECEPWDWRRENRGGGTYFYKESRRGVKVVERGRGGGDNDDADELVPEGTRGTEP